MPSESGQNIPYSEKGRKRNLSYDLDSKFDLRTLKQGVAAYISCGPNWLYLTKGDGYYTLEKQRRTKTKMIMPYSIAHRDLPEDGQDLTDEEVQDFDRMLPMPLSSITTITHESIALQTWPSFAPRSVEKETLLMAR